jgi:hypothetical protein
VRHGNDLPLIAGAEGYEGAFELGEVFAVLTSTSSTSPTATGSSTRRASRCCQGR